MPAARFCLMQGSDGAAWERWRGAVRRTLLAGDVGARGCGVEAVQHEGALQAGAALVAQHRPRDGAIQPNLDHRHHLIPPLVGDQERAHEALRAGRRRRARVARHHHHPPALTRRPLRHPLDACNTYHEMIIRAFLLCWSSWGFV